MGVGGSQDEGEQGVSKRPSLIGGLTLPTTDEPALVAPEPAAEPQAPAPERPAPPKPAAGRRPRPDVVHTSVYLPREVHRRLREIAFTRDVKVHDVIMEGIDAAFAEARAPAGREAQRRDVAP